MIQIGPVGGPGGGAFLDPNQSGSIVELRVRHGAYVDNIEIVYSNGVSIQHGGSGGNGPDVFTLYQNEFLVSVDGTISGLQNGGPFIGSIRFTTNTGRVSPYFGTQYAMAYILPAGPCPTASYSAIQGFFGNAGGYLDALGIITEY